MYVFVRHSVTQALLLVACGSRLLGKPPREVWCYFMRYSWLLCESTNHDACEFMRYLLQCYLYDRPTQNHAQELELMECL
jgi:hypothetical protein